MENGGVKRLTISAIAAALILGMIGGAAQQTAGYTLRASGGDAWAYRIMVQAMDDAAQFLISPLFVITACAAVGAAIYSWADFIVRKWRERWRLTKRLSFRTAERRLMAMTLMLLLGGGFALSVLWVAGEQFLAKPDAPSAKSPKRTAAKKDLLAPSITESRLRLHFRPENSVPGAEELLNIWRWYALQHIVNFLGPQGQRGESRAWTLFITLDKPMNVSQIRVESNAKLPQYEVKDSDGRSAVIAFMGPITDAIVDVRFLSSENDKATLRLEPPAPPPPPRPLSTYEAEQKIRVIDSVLKILRTDMQPLEDKWYLPQLGHAWNALKDPSNNPNYLKELLTYRDLFKSHCESLITLRNNNSEYPDIVSATEQPNYEAELKPIEDFLVLSQQLLTYLKPDIGNDDFNRILGNSSAAALKATQEFIVWRTQTRIKMEKMRVELQSDTMRGGK
jgi:hypothetical protein